VAILGTTISPYLFFWQASEEVEEEKAQGERTLKQRQGATAKELAVRRMDVGIGTFASNLVMFFIIIVTAVTLHKHGITKIETSKQAAEALRPLAGEFAYQDVEIRVKLKTRTFSWVKFSKSNMGTAVTAVPSGAEIRPLDSRKAARSVRAGLFARSPAAF
jgi:hypothetical protein